MVFDSYTFLAFLAVVLALHHLPVSWTWRKVQLLLASWIFYAAWNPPFVLLLWFSTVSDWYAAERIARTRSTRVKRAWLVASLVANLGMLSYFKYGTFLLENAVQLTHAFGIDWRPAHASIILPVGISFYTFQTLSYTIDVYRGRETTARSFLDYALYVTFFPQLVAGPIVRSTDFLWQLVEPRRASAKQMGWGFALLTLGLFEKNVLADGVFSNTVEVVFEGAFLPTVGEAWAASLGFSWQIFCDFAGYSTCAIGAALLLGFSIPDNFRFPYAAIGFSDQWRRWHITLSSWLRDYLYIPLGGNRLGPMRTHLNLMATMLIGGLWHGASWTFVAWGGLHGIYLVVERGLRRIFTGDENQAPRVVRLLLAAATFTCWVFAFVFFRAKSFERGFDIAFAMFGRAEHARAWMLGARGTLVLILAGALFLLHFACRDTSLERMAERSPAWLRIVILAALLVGIATIPGEDRAFIYFQF